mmetsp:Transcript_894/g.2426  ORF Transcript_894/g.2426 Transcript_894/m.2426 type:complete len:102 (-) Transcript_894:112-417(-)
MDDESMEKMNKRKDDPSKVDVRKRDYTEATGFDKFDTEAMPEIIAKAGRKFGMRSQTKYTHLTNEDTTDFQGQRMRLGNDLRLGGDRHKSTFDARRKRQKR